MAERAGVKVLRRTLCAVGLLVAPAAAQVEPAENLFYHAFFLDRGERAVDPALDLYQKFIQAAPTHPLAPEAARYTVNLLQQANRAAEADAFAKAHAALLAGSVRPGINARFLDPGARVAQFQAMFEGESREIFRHRAAIAATVGLRAGQRVADIGAGTGVFTWPFARAVGKEGRVYAVDISQPMVDHIARTAKNGGLDQVAPVLCSERSVQLPEASIDVAFVCDTYHHFEFPAETLASIHAALRPGGQLVVVDFIRIPGRSRQWILDHVRAGQEQVVAEIAAAGFDLVRVEETPLTENYCLRFARK